MPQSKKVPFWRSLQTKFAMTYILIVAAVLILLNTYPVMVSQDLAYRSKETSMQNQAAVLASALATGPEALTAEGAARTVELLLGSLGVTRIMVTDPNGLVLCDFQEGTARTDTTGQYALFWELVTALQGNDVFRSDYADGVFHSRAAVPVTYRSMTQGAVYLYEYDAEQGAMLQGIQTNLRFISLVICLVTLVMGVVFAKALTRRIALLLGAIRTVREGEYSHRVSMGGGDELSRLADEFNELTGRLQTTEEVRRRFVSDASHELKTPLASIRLLTDSILQADHMDSETAREFLTDIGDEAERLTRITEKLLTLTRLDTAPAAAAVPVDVGAVVERVEHMLTPPGPGGGGGAGAASPARLPDRGHGGRAVPDRLQPDGERGEVQPARREGLCHPPGGRPPGAPAGGGHRRGHSGGGSAQDLRPLLPGGQGPLPGRRRHRSGPVHRVGHGAPLRRHGDGPAAGAGGHLL